MLQIYNFLAESNFFIPFITRIKEIIMQERYNLDKCISKDYSLGISFIKNKSRGSSKFVFILWIVLYFYMENKYHTISYQNNLIPIYLSKKIFMQCKWISFNEIIYFLKYVTVLLLTCLSQNIPINQWNPYTYKILCSILIGRVIAI